MRAGWTAIRTTISPTRCIPISPAAPACRRCTSLRTCSPTDNWDTLATAAKWARARADVLRDSHWIGGDPARGEVYGWASWSPQRAVIGLRNPSAQAQTLHMDLARALELPEDAARAWKATPAFSAGSGRTLNAGTVADVELGPYEVLVWDLVPGK